MIKIPNYNIIKELHPYDIQQAHLFRKPYIEDSKEANSSANITGKIIGINSLYVKKMRTVLAYCDDSDIEAVENEDLKLNDAWEKAKEIKEKIKAELNAVKQFNFTNDNIKWAKWTWNPVTGCKHGCDYCYNGLDVVSRLIRFQSNKSEFIMCERCYREWNIKHQTRILDVIKCGVKLGREKNN